MSSVLTSEMLWGNAEIADYMGLVELSKDSPEPHLFVYGMGETKRRWAAKNNGTNRALNDTNWQSLLEFMVHQRWGLTGEPLLRTSDHKVLSAQHRLTAAVHDIGGAYDRQTGESLYTLPTE